MRKILNYLLGYELIDIVTDYWSFLPHADFKNGGDDCYLEPITVSVYHNPRKGKYKMYFKGYHYEQHPTVVVMRLVLTYLSNDNAVNSMFAPKNRNVSDYFLNKEIAFNTQIPEESGSLIAETKPQVERDIQSMTVKHIATSKKDDTSIVSISLEEYEKFKYAVISKDPTLVKSMQDYNKKVLSKKEGLEIYKEEDNLVVTSDGCYFSSYSSNIRYDNEETDPQS